MISLLRQTSTALAAVALLATSPSAPAFAQPGLSDAELRSFRDECPAMRNIDFHRLAAIPDDGNWRNEARQLMHATDQPQLGDADIVLRFYAPPPAVGGGATTRTTARRVNGEWLVRREDQLLTSSQPVHDPYRLDFRSRRPQSPTIVREGPLDPAMAATIENALADSCFEREPDVSPSVLPLRRNAQAACYDGVPFFLQVERTNRVITRVHVCQPRWRTGEIIRALESAQTIEARTTVTETLSPLMLVDANGQNIPADQAPPPSVITLNGDVGGREVTIKMGGNQIYAGVPPSPARWIVWSQIGEPAPAFEIAVAGCPGVVNSTVGPGQGISLTARGCRLTTP